jgi:hypothetical protein
MKGFLLKKNQLLNNNIGWVVDCVEFIVNLIVKNLKLNKTERIGNAERILSSRKCKCQFRKFA